MAKRKLTDAQRKAMYAKAKGRPYQAMNRDRSVTAQRTLPDTPKNREVWASNPRRYDLVGVDDKRTVKGKGINNVKTISRLPDKNGQEINRMENTEIKTHDLGDGWTATTEQVYVSKIGDTDLITIYRVYTPDGREIKSISEQDKIMPDESDIVLDALMPRQINNVRQNYNRGDESILAHANTMRKDMYYTVGDTYPVKDEIKAAGMEWNGDIKRWESLHQSTAHIEGITFEKIPTYKPKNTWGYYKE